VQWKSIDISEENIASTFRVEEEAKQETSMKYVASNSGIYLRRGSLHNHRCENLKS
jgi:uncharacterized membrane protein